MARINRSKTREIIDDFAVEIKNRTLITPGKPSKHVINFRDEMQARKGSNLRLTLVRL